ncbi:MAG: hypothetical protein A2Y73_01400 [Chloroflexi bacterium RBG_13_56_8]|nr:MAG: hypothetical protein A2Y73_01400 [Chloroflexi bacterium RBG_13_56_8]
MEKSRVALMKGDDRYQNVLQALEAIQDDIDLTGKRRVVVKPNFVSVYIPQATTHVDAVRAVLDFLKARGVTGVTLAEGPASGTLQKGIRSYGYQPLIDAYHLRTVDLNEDDPVEIEVYDDKLRSMRLPVARTLVESDYRISVGPPKTHDTVVATLSLKNLAVGSIIGRKRRVHQGYPGINLNLYKLAYHVAPHLSVIDGFRAMEGNGPVNGRPVDWKIAIASADFLAADSLGAQLMGFTLEEIGYLYYCQLKGLGQGNREEMELVGNASFDEVRRKFQPHHSYHSQLNWKIPQVEQYL